LPSIAEQSLEDENITTLIACGMIRGDFLQPQHSTNNTFVSIKYDKRDQQGKAAFIEHNPHMISNKEQWQGAQADPKKTGQGTRQSKDRLINKMIMFN
jgi:hypothetical protein